MKVMKDVAKITGSVANTAVTSLGAIEHTTGMISEAMFSARMEQLQEIKSSLGKLDINELKSLSQSIRDWNA